MQMRPNILKTDQSQFTESTACIYKTPFCLCSKTSFLATAGRWYLHLGEEELPLEKLRGTLSVSG